MIKVLLALPGSRGDFILGRIFGKVRKKSSSPYYSRGVYEYMDGELDTFKICLTGSMLALAKDEELEDFYKNLMNWEDDEGLKIV